MKLDSSKFLSEKIKNMAESATLQMAKKARALRAEGHEVISLSLGEPDFDTPLHIKEAAKQALDQGFTKYTPVPGIPELREAICTKLKRDNNLIYKPSQVVVSNGAKQTIANLCAALLDPGDEVIIFTPYWVSYIEIVRIAGGSPVVVKAGIEQDFKVKPEQLDAAISSKTKAILFSSPCNPTGSVYTQDELEALAAVIANHGDILVLSDEIYEYINFQSKHASIGAIESMRENTVTINGFSKGFAMTGWRLGYMAGPEWLAIACAKVQGQVTSGANAFGQKAAAYALLSDMEPSQKMKDAYSKRKVLVTKMLGEIPGINCNDPKGAFYVFPNISAYFGKSDGSFTINNSNDFAELLLTKAHVAVVAGSAFGDNECFRLSYAASEDELTRAITKIGSVLNGFS